MQKLNFSTGILNFSYVGHESKQCLWQNPWTYVLPKFLDLWPIKIVSALFATTNSIYAKSQNGVCTKNQGCQLYPFFQELLCKTFKNLNLVNIVLRGRRAGGYDFCKPAGVISSQGAKPRGLKWLPRVSKNHTPPNRQPRNGIAILVC